MNTPYKLFAFDNYFKDADSHYSAAEQWDILKELGYDKGYLSINLSDEQTWDHFLELSEQRRRTGLSLAAVYTVIDFSQLDTRKHTPEEVLAQLEPGDTFELALSRGWKADCSDPAYDDEAIAFIQSLLPQARERGVKLSLYHHLGFWQERIEDCVRIARKVNDPALGVTFCGYHWYACDGKDLITKLKEAAPWLKLANLCGSRSANLRPFAGALPCTIEPVGEGDFPLAEMLAGLNEIGYTGDVGFQGYKVGGYPPLTLKRSIEAFRMAEKQALANT